MASVYTLGDGVFFFSFFLEGVSSKHTALRIHVKMCSKITKEVHGTNESDIVVAPITYLIYLLSKIKKKKKERNTQLKQLHYNSAAKRFQWRVDQGKAVLQK